MDLTKLCTNQQVNYRLTKKDRKHNDRLIDSLLDLSNDYPDTKFTALEFMGMLWMGVETDTQYQVPHTRAERQYMVALSDNISKHFGNGEKYGNPRDVNYNLHLEMIERCKQTLIALHYNALSPDTLHMINEKLHTVILPVPAHERTRTVETKVDPYERGGKYYAPEYGEDGPRPTPKPPGL